MRMRLGVLTVMAMGTGLGFFSAPSTASTRVGVFAIVDEVAFEPSATAPERIWISGVFVVPVPISSGRHQAPLRGQMYFGLNPESPDETRRDWAALAELAGTGQAAGFGEYWVLVEQTESGTSNTSLEVRVHATRDGAAPAPYPKPNRDGVVTAFDTEQDARPRFGAPSKRIIGALWEAKFGDQRRDPAWASDAERRLLSLISQTPGLALTSLDVECREATCRARLFFPPEQGPNASDGLHAVIGAAERATDLRVFSAGAGVGSDGVPAADVYFHRGGAPE